MTVKTLRLETRRTAILVSVIALACVYAFLQDLLSPQWFAWVLTPLVGGGFAAAVTIAPQDGVVRAVLWQSALLLVPFMGVYTLLDHAFIADWPEWVIAPTVVLLLWGAMSLIIDAESD